MLTEHRVQPPLRDERHNVRTSAARQEDLTNTIHLGANQRLPA
jgi:hypothetical protein